MLHASRRRRGEELHHVFNGMPVASLHTDVQRDVPLSFQTTLSCPLCVHMVLSYSANMSCAWGPQPQEAVYIWTILEEWASRIVMASSWDGNLPLVSQSCSADLISLNDMPLLASVAVLTLSL